MPSPSPPDIPFPFNIIPYAIGIGFLLVFGSIAYSLISSATQYMADDASPVETVEAIVLAKRDKATYHTNNSPTTNSRWTSYSYFVTFEYSNGQRREFGIRESEYGVLIEGDQGTLTFQGSRYKGFARHN